MDTYIEIKKEPNVDPTTKEILDPHGQFVVRYVCSPRNLIHRFDDPQIARSFAAGFKTGLAVLNRPEDDIPIIDETEL